MILSSRELVSTARWGGAFPSVLKPATSTRSVEVSHAVRRVMIKRSAATARQSTATHRDEIVLTGFADSVFRARLFELAPIMAWWAS